MNYLSKYLFSILLSLLICIIFNKIIYSDIIEISRIRIVINEAIYNWEDEKDIPEKEKNEFTSPATVISYLSIRPKQLISIKELSNSILIDENRLINSGIFYTVSINIIPPKTDINKRTILVKVSDGFTDRFMGGPIFGMYGKDNLFGLRKSFKVFLGYNIIGGEYIDELFLNSPFIVGAKFYYNNQGFENIIGDYDQFITTLISGYRFHPDIKLQFNLEHNYFKYKYINSNMNVNYLASTNLNDLIFSLNLDSLFNYYINSDYRLAINIIPDIKVLLPIINDYNLRITSLNRLIIRIFYKNNLSFNLQTSISLSSDSLPFYYKYDLYYKPDLSVRSGYPQNFYNLLSDNFFMQNIELRYKIIDFSVFNIFKIIFSGFLFGDLAFYGNYNEDIFNKPFIEAYGCGLRVRFDIPVNVNITLGIGFDRYFKNRAFFTMTEGF